MGVCKRETRWACPSKMERGPALHTSPCHASAAAQRAASLPLLAFGHFPLTGGIGPPSRAQNSAAFAALRFFALAPVHPRCSARLRISLYAPQGRGNHSHAPKYAFLNCVLLPYRIGRSGVPRPYSSGKNGICPDHGSVGQTSAALRTTASQNLAAIAGGHTLTEAVLLGTLALLGLIGTKHGGHLLT